jgi:hypothetical protein
MSTVQKVKFGYFRLLHGGHSQAKRDDEGKILPRLADDGTVITDGRGNARPLIEKFRADRINNVFPVIRSTTDLTEEFGYEKFQRLTPQEVALLVTDDESEQELDLTGMTLPQLKRFAREMDIEIPDDVVGKEQVRNYIQSEIDSR